MWYKSGICSLHVRGKVRRFPSSQAAHHWKCRSFVGCSRHADFNKDSLLFSSALKCKLFHRSLLLCNTTERKTNTAMLCRTKSLCFLEHHNVPTSCSSGSTWSAFHLKSLCWKQCELRIGTVVHTAPKVRYKAQALIEILFSRYLSSIRCTWGLQLFARQRLFSRSLCFRVTS